MAKGQAWDRRTLRRTREAVEYTEGLPRGGPGPQARGTTQNRLPLIACKNTGDEELVPGDVVRVVQGAEYQSAAAAGYYCLEVEPASDTPEDAFPPYYAVVLRGAQPDKFGIATLAGPVWVYYDPGSGQPPAAGELWGPKPDKTVLTKHWPGFVALGHNVEEDERTLVIPEPVRVLEGKTLASIAKGGEGNVKIWVGDGSSMTDSQVTVKAWNRFAALGSGKWVRLQRLGTRWYLVAAEC